MTQVPVRQLTAEEFFAMPQDDRRYELVSGAPIEMSPASPRSSEVAITIAALLLAFVRPRRLGRVYGSEAGFILRRNPDAVRAPDVAFVRADRPPDGAKQDFFLALAPDLAVVVVSPSDRLSDVNDKVREYLEAGVQQLVWVVEPRARRATVRYPDGSAKTVLAEGYLEGETVLPGLRIELAEVFGDGW